MAKQVLLKQLSLVNFKGLRNVTIDFKSLVTIVSGKNGTGKTTICDAFTWLLWGKDSEGNSDSKFGIETTDEDGKVIHDLNHVVTGILEVTDTDTGETETIKLSRVYLEEWKTKRGETERTLKGHRTDFYYNDVPLNTKAEYDKRVSEIIPEDIFKLITNPGYFLSLHWEAQRTILMKLAGDISNEELAANDAKFTKLLADLTGKTLEDFKKETAVAISKVNKELETIPTRKDEVLRATPAEPDYEALEAEKKQLQEELEQMDAAAASIAEANRQTYAKSSSIQREINEKQQRQQKILFEAKNNSIKQAQEANLKFNEVSMQAKAIRERFNRERQTLISEIQRTSADIQRAKDAKQRYERQADEARKRWYDVNAEEFKEEGTLTCPLFKHCCKDEAALQAYNNNTEAAKKTFMENKEAKLTQISEDGKKIVEQIAQLEKEINELSAELARLENAKTDEPTVERDFLEQNKDIIEKGMVEPTPVIPTAIPEYCNLQEEIESLSQELTDLQDGCTSEYTIINTREQKAKLNERLDEIKAKLSLREIIDSNKNRIAQLEELRATLAQEKASLESRQIVIDAFVKARMTEVERRINGFFKLCTFQMFKTQVNGEEAPDCVCFVEGTRYQDKNNAGKINAGLDIINTLCTFHGVTAPIFIDNAERVNDFIPTTSQLIELAVTKDSFKVTEA
jgi:DNA repair exonuclease SbcCD ATPase subunit